MAIVVVALLVVAGSVAAFVPQTVAEGGQGETAWRLRVAPGVFSPSVRLEAPRWVESADGFASPPSLHETAIWQAPEADATIVVGPTPRDASSIRVTSVERGVGEAAVERVLWRRMHVAVLPGDVWVTELVAIDRAGQSVQVVADLPPPPVPEVEATAP